MSKVTAKVILATKSQHAGGHAGLTFQADYAGGRNAEWAQFTPSLSLQMTVKPEVADLFEAGGRYTLTFSPDED